MARPRQNRLDPFWLSVTPDPDRTVESLGAAWSPSYDDAGGLGLVVQFYVDEQFVEPDRRVRRPSAVLGCWAREGNDPLAEPFVVLERNRQRRARLRVSNRAGI